MAYKNKIITITPYQLDILKKIYNDPILFADYAKVVHPIQGKVPFDLYEYQKTVLYYFLTRRFNIVKKFRQAGITELLCLYALWLAMFRPHKNIQIISIKDRVAKRFLKRIKFFYRNLPEWLRIPIINGRPGDLGTVTEMEFSNGSLITSMPTTEDSGRSEAASLLIIDEAAIVRWANVIWAAAFPTLSTGGSAILASTPYGVGNFFHKTWVDAIASAKSPTDFNPINLTWDMHPERDLAWYTMMAKKLGPRRTAQEIDGDFLASGNTVFDLADIKAIEDMIAETPVHKTEMNGRLVYLNPPMANEQYWIGSDIASGRARDYTAFDGMNRQGIESFYFKGKIPVDKAADLLGRVGLKYNHACIAPESNDIGLAVTKLLQVNGYPNLYYSERLLKEKGESKPKVVKEPGWYTTSKTRPIIIDELESDIREENVDIRNPFFADEAYTFIYDSANRPVAMGKENKNGTETDLELGDDDFTDDSIISTAITNFIRKGKINNVFVTPK